MKVYIKKKEKAQQDFAEKEKPQTDIENKKANKQNKRNKTKNKERSKPTPTRKAEAEDHHYVPRPDATKKNADGGSSASSGSASSSSGPSLGASGGSASSGPGPSPGAAEHNRTSPSYVACTECEDCDTEAMGRPEVKDIEGSDPESSAVPDRYPASLNHKRAGKRHKRKYVKFDACGCKQSCGVELARCELEHRSRASDEESMRPMMQA